LNSALLKGKIVENSMTQTEVSQNIGISLSRFNAKLNNTGGAEFTLGEVRALKELLNLDSTQVEKIFFS